MRLKKGIVENLSVKSNYEMETDVKSKINKELKKLKFNFTYKGTNTYLNVYIKYINQTNRM